MESSGVGSEGKVDDFLTITVRQLCHPGEEVVTVESDLTLDKLRKRLQHHCDNCHFLTDNVPIACHQESKLQVRDVLPKLFHGLIPQNEFTFPGIEYKQVELSISGQSIKVLCALVLQLVPDGYEGGTNLFHSIYFKPPLSADWIALDSLFESCATGSLCQVSQILDDWPKSTIQEWFSSLSSSAQATPLHLAVENGHLEVSKLLLEHFPEVAGHRDAKGNTALDYALQWKQFDIVAELLSRLPKSDTEPCSLTLLESYSDTDLVNLGSEIQSASFISFPLLAKCLLHSAIIKHDVVLGQRIVEMLRHENNFLNRQDELGWTLLHHCVSSGNVPMVTSLYEAGVDITIKAHHQLTPFLLACHQGKFEMFPYLIKENPSNDTISQAVEMALRYGHIKTVEEVLRLAQDGCVLSQKAWNMIATAANRDYQKCAEILRLCPDMDEKGVVLNRFLLEAARQGDVCTMMKLLSKTEVDVNFQDFMGHSALHEAVLAEKTSVINTLCQHPDIEINIQNWRGESPLHYACKKGIISLVAQLLKQENINVFLQDHMGMTPVVAALTRRQFHILDLFLEDESHQRCLLLHDNTGKNVLHFAPYFPASMLDRLVFKQTDTENIVSHQKEAKKSVNPCSVFLSSVEENKPDTQENVNSLPRRLRHLGERHSENDCRLTYCIACDDERLQARLAGMYFPPKRPMETVPGKGRPFEFHKQQMKPSDCDHPLHIAVKLKRKDLFSKLASTIQHLRAKDCHERTPVELAVDLLHADCVAELLKVQYEMEPSWLDEAFTPLLNRCLRADTWAENDSERRVGVLKAILKYGPNRRLVGESPSQENSPLVKACFLGLAECVELILQSDAYLDYVPAVLTAVQAGHTEVLSKLFLKLDQHQDGKSLFEKLSRIRDQLGRNLLGVALCVKGDQALSIVKTIIGHCPSLLEFPLFNETKIKSRSFMCSNTTGVTTLRNCRGNTILECITEKKYANSSEKNLWEEVGCFLIEHGADREIVEVGGGNVIHACCGAFHAAVRHGFWRIAVKLMDRGASRQAWLCANNPQHSSCQQMLGLMMDDIVHHLCHPNAPENLLIEVLQVGLELQKEGAIQVNVNPGNLEQIRLLWIAQSCHASYVFEEDHLKEFDILVKLPMVTKPQKPVDMVIIQAMQPLIGWKKRVQKRSRSLAKFFLKAPTKRKRKNTDPGKKYGKASVSPQVRSVTTPQQVINQSPASTSPPKMPCTPRMIFTPTPSAQSLMCPRSARLARSKRKRPHKRVATPSVFYLGEGTPSPGFSPGGSSPLVSPSAALHHCIYISYVSQETSMNPETPVDGAMSVFIPDYMPQTPNKLNKFYIRTQFKYRMMQSVAAILQIQPSLTRRVVACLKMADVDFVSNLIPRRTLSNTQLAEKFLLDRTTLKLAFEGSTHETSVFVEACLQGETEVVKKILGMAATEALQKMVRSHVVRVGKRRIHMKVTAIGAAASKGHEVILHLLLDKGLRPTWQDLQACMTASSHFKEEESKSLLQRLISSVEPSEGDEVYQKCTLLEAARQGQTEIIRALLEHHRQLHCPGYLREAFITAAEKNHSDAASVLLESLQEECSDISYLLEVLPMASQSKAWQVVSEVVGCTNSSSSLMQTDAAKKTVLHHAVIDGQFEIVKLCLEKMLSVEDHESEDGKTFVNLKDLRKRSALWYACQSGQVEIAILLLAFGASPGGAGSITEPSRTKLKVWLDTSQIATARNVPLIQVACGRGLTDVVEGILNLQPNLLQDNDCMTHCLFSALINGKIETYNLLRNEGVEVNDMSLVMALLMNLQYTATGEKSYGLKENLTVTETMKQHLSTGYPEALRFGKFVRLSISYILVELSREYSSYVIPGARGSVEAAEGLTLLDELLVSMPVIEPDSLASTRLAALTSVIGEAEVTEKLLQHSPSIVTPMHVSSEENPYSMPQLGQYQITLTDMVVAAQNKEQACENIAAIEKVMPEHSLCNLAVLLACLRQMPEVLNDSVICSLCSVDDTYQGMWPHIMCYLLQCRSDDLFLPAIQKVMEARVGGLIGDVSTHQAEVVLTLLLHLAVSQNKVTHIKPLLDLGANCFSSIQEEDLKDLNLLNSRWCPPTSAQRKFTAFHWAFYVGSNECLNILLSEVSPVETVSEEKVKREFGSELWLIAVSRGHIAMLQWLTGQGPGSNYNMDYMEPAQSVDFVRLLGQSLNPVTLLLTAAKGGRFETLHWLLDRFSESALRKLRELTSQEEENLYHSLAALRNEDAAMQLIYKLISLDVPGMNSVDQHGLTPLGYAQKLGNLRTQTHLLRCGASLHEREILGRKWCIYHGALRLCVNETTASDKFEPVSGEPVGKPSYVFENQCHRVKVSGIPQRLYQRLILGDDIMAYSMLRSIEPVVRQSPMPDIISKYLMSLFQKACRSGCPKSLELLLDILHDQGNACESMMLKSLLLTVKRNHVPCIRLFKKVYFLDPQKVTDEKTRENLLHLAVRSKNKEMIQTVVSLLGEPGPLREPDLCGLTPVTCAESLDGMTDILAECIHDYTPTPKVETSEKNEQKPKQDPELESERQRVFQSSLNGVSDSKEMSDWEVVDTEADWTVTGGGALDSSPEVESVKERINSHTIPALQSVIKTKIQKANVAIEIDWHSFFGGMTPEETEEGLQLLDIFHHSKVCGVQFAGLGFTLDQCSQFLYWRKRLVGEIVLKRDLEGESWDFDVIKIQRGTPGEKTSLENKTVIWKFDLHNGKVLYDQNSLPLWTILRQHYLAALTLIQPVSVVKQRGKKKEHPHVRFNLDWNRLLSMVPPKNIPVLITGPIAEELNRFSLLFKSSQYLEGDFEGVELSFGDASSTDAAVKTEGGTIHLNMVILKKQENGRNIWDAKLPCLDETMTNLKVKSVCSKLEPDQVDHIEVVSGGNERTSTVGIKFERSASEYVIRNSLRDMKRPEGIWENCLKQLKDITKESLEAAVRTSIFHISSGLYVCPKVWEQGGKPQDETSHNGYMQFSGRHMKVLDNELCYAIQQGLPECITITYFEQEKAVDDHKEEKELFLNVPQILGMLQSPLKMDIAVKTNWNQTNQSFIDIVNLIVTDKETAEIQHEIQGVLKHCQNALSLPNDTSEDGLKDVLTTEIDQLLFHSEKLKKIRWLHHRVEDVKTALTYCGGGEGKVQMSPNELLGILSHVLQQDQASRTTMFMHVVRERSKNLDSRFELEANVCPVRCNLIASHLYPTHFPFSVDSLLNVSEEECATEVRVELRDINGKRLADGRAVSGVSVGLCVLQPDYRLIKLPIQVSQVQDSSGSLLSIKWQVKDAKECLTKFRDRKDGLYLQVQVEGFPIQGSPFPAFPRPGLNRGVSQNNYQAPVSEPVQLVLTHTHSRKNTKTTKQIAPKSKPSEYMCTTRRWRQLRQEGWRQCWSLDSVRGFSDHPVVCQVERHNSKVISWRVTPQKVGDLGLMAYCEACQEKLQFIIPDGLPCSELHIKATPGRPSRKLSSVVDSDFKRVPPKDIKWCLKAGEKLDFLFKVSDSHGNPAYLAGVTLTPEFTFSSESGDTVNTTSECVDAEKGVFKLQTVDFRKAATYQLELDGSPTGYTLKVTPSVVDPAMCRVTGSGLSTTNSGTRGYSFKVILADKFGNVVIPTNDTLYFNLSVTSTLMEMSVSKKIVENVTNCSYTTPADLRSTFQLMVCFDGVHLKGSPFTVKWTSTKTFDQKYRELRKALSKLKRAGGACTLMVRRDQVLEDSFGVFQRMDAALLHYPTEVHFFSEQGLDAGGLTREWYQLLSRAIFNPSYALFEPVNGNRYQPNRNSGVQEDHLAYFYFVGQVFGKAIFDGENLDVHLVSSVYKTLLELAPDLKDLAQADPTLHRSLDLLAKMSTEEEVQAMCLSFTIDESSFGSSNSVPLKPGGADIEVTLENRDEYIRCYIHHVLYERVQSQMSQFKEGFASVIPLKLVSELRPSELELLMCGPNRVNIIVLRGLTTYRDGYDPQKKQIYWLWNLLNSWDQEKIKSFLQFVTGNTRLPAFTRDWRLNIIRLPDSDNLPTASTCFNQLMMPAYKKQSKLVKKLTTAVELGSQGFGKM